MVAKLWWPPSPPFRYVSRKYEAVILIQRLEGLKNLKQFDDEEDDSDNEKKKEKRLVVEIKWKGQTTFPLLGGLRRKISKRNLTEEGGVCGDGAVEWNEEFKCFCNFSGHMDDFFFPWEVEFTVFNGLDQGKRKKIPVVGTASLNLTKFANSSEEEFEVKVPLTVSGDTTEDAPSLYLSIRLIESRITQESSKAGKRSIVPLTSPPRSTEAPSKEKDERSAVKASLQKVKTFKDYVSGRRAKKICNEEECSDGIRSEDAECNFPSDDDDDAAKELDMDKEKAIAWHSFSYETLASSNWAGGLCYANTIINPEDEDWIYYSSHKSNPVENATTPVVEQSLQQSAKRRILHWRKRKLSFRSPKTKGEPLLKKDYKEEGGDDIDFDRRQFSSSDESSFGWKSEGSTTSRSSFSEFGDDNFSVGSWERKEVISRDGHMKLQAQVFFASIDQRSERAAGESACTALVAVIANWLKSNQDEMPIKSEFDSLISEGSLEWRNLCENESYIRWFPDKHFDLETVLQAKIRPLSVVQEKSFVGFFHPESLKGGDFDFLHGAMSFDNIWDEIIRYGSDQPGNVDPLIYIISWNDHFFVLKVDQDAYYIIDTLGERLYEGCNQAYVLKFDKDTTIQRLPKETKPSGEKKASDKAVAKQPRETSGQETQVVCQNESENSEEAAIVCRGKESCKEYIKSFLAAIPIRELQADIKKGLMASTPLHHRLQIEFHYTQLLQPASKFSAKEVTAANAPLQSESEEIRAGAPVMPISLACA